MPPRRPERRRNWSSISHWTRENKLFTGFFFFFELGKARIKMQCLSLKIQFSYSDPVWIAPHLDHLIQPNSPATPHFVSSSGISLLFLHATFTQSWVMMFSSSSHLFQGPTSSFFSYLSIQCPLFPLQSFVLIVIWHLSFNYALIILCVCTLSPQLQHKCLKVRHHVCLC